MRRTLSLLLLLLVGFPLIAPLFASTSEANLPLCCRKNGAHHCMGIGMMMQSGTTLTNISAKCPAFPRATAAMQLHPVLLKLSASRIASIIAHPSGKPQTEARYRIAFSRSRQKRGPPTILS